MAYATTLETVKKELAEGQAEWVNSGFALLTHLVEFCQQHTHTGTVDGLVIPDGGFAAGSIDAADLDADSVTTVKILNSNVTTAKIADDKVTPAKLTAAAKANSVDWAYWVEAATLVYPVFYAPVACVVSAPALPEVPTCRRSQLHVG